MSLSRIILYAIGLGLVIGFLADRLADNVPATPVGMAVTLISVVVAGKLHPAPRERR